MLFIFFVLGPFDRSVVLRPGPKTFICSRCTLMFVHFLPTNTKIQRRINGWVKIIFQLGHNELYGYLFLHFYFLFKHFSSSFHPSTLLHLFNFLQEVEMHAKKRVRKSRYKNICPNAKIWIVGRVFSHNWILKMVGINTNWSPKCSSLFSMLSIHISTYIIHNKDSCVHACIF